MAPGYGAAGAQERGEAARPAERVAADSLRAAAGPSPQGVLVRSLLVPGWGQWTLGHRVKAGLFAATSGALVAWTVAAQRDLDRVSSRLADLRSTAPSSSQIPALRLRQQNLAARRNTRVLWVVLAVAGAGLDAYVDAHLATFDADIDPAAAPAPGDAIGLTWRWRW